MPAPILWRRITFSLIYVLYTLIFIEITNALKAYRCPDSWIWDLIFKDFCRPLILAFFIYFQLSKLLWFSRLCDSLSETNFLSCKCSRIDANIDFTVLDRIRREWHLSLFKSIRPLATSVLGFSNIYCLQPPGQRQALHAQATRIVNTVVQLNQSWAGVPPQLAPIQFTVTIAPVPPQAVLAALGQPAGTQPSAKRRPKRSKPKRDRKVPFVRQC